MADSTTRHEGNPLLGASDLPYGLPDFTAVTPTLLREALDEGMAREAQAWREIAATQEPADVANTVEAVARAARGLDRAVVLLHTLASSVGTEDYQDLAAEYLPQLAAHADDFWLNLDIYRRFESLERARPLLDLPADVVQYVEDTLRTYRLGGIELDENSRGVLREINMQLAALETDFSRRVTRAGLDGLSVRDPQLLAGLDEATLEALYDGSAYRIDLLNTTQQPLASRLTDAALRAELLAASTSRCGQAPFGTDGNGGEPDFASTTDTRMTLLEIARLRAQRAELLGHPNHASVVAARNDARTTERIDTLLDSLGAPVLAQVGRELDALRELAADEGLGERIGASDVTYLYGLRRRAAAQLDDEQLRPYLELDRVLVDGVFHAAHLLYGLSFRARPDLQGWAENVRVWEVLDADGSGLGLFVGDFFTRPGKQGGAWMHALVDQSHLFGTRPVICNNANFRPPAPGEPTLLTWDEVRTTFHEFGHALHGLLSDVRLPQQSGTHVERDTVEYPSQVNEIWMTHPLVLGHFARHHATDELLPAELTERVRAAEAVARGFETLEHLAAVQLDQAWHRLAPADVPTEPQQVDAFERAALERLGLAHDLVPPRYRSTYFRHTFGGGYDAGYYSYLWAEQLDADTTRWFATAADRGGDLGLNRWAGDRFRAEVLARGGTRPMSASFHALRGRDVRPDALLARKGLQDDDGAGAAGTP